MTGAIHPVMAEALRPYLNLGKAVPSTTEIVVVADKHLAFVVNGLLQENAILKGKVTELTQDLDSIRARALAIATAEAEMWR